MNVTVVIMMIVCFGPMASAAVMEPIVIPFVTDPSPVIDGNPAEWVTHNRGVFYSLEKGEQVTFYPEGWKGVEDLSGWVRLGYDNENLFIACHVVDSYFIQDQSSCEVWRGDHVLCNFDFIGSGKIEDVMMVGLSPGSLKEPDSLGAEIKPELVIWEPYGASIEGAVVAAVRTAEGYDIEAAVPWEVLRVKPSQFQTFAMEIGFSDCDTTPTSQEKMITIDTRQWRARNSQRLIRAGLADRAGNFPMEAFAEATVLAEHIELKYKEKQEFVVDVDRIAEGKIPTLTFKARVQNERAAGCCGPLATSVNGKGITQHNIANRPAVVTFLNGGMQTSWYGAGVTLWYGPSFESIEKSTCKPLDVVSYDYILRLDGMIKEGKNTITFRNADARENIVVVMEDIAFSWSSPSRFWAVKKPAKAPVGTIPTFRPWTEHKVDYKVSRLSGGGLKVNWANRELVFKSRFSKPDGTWVELNEKDSPGWKKLGERNIFSGVDEKVVFVGRTDDLEITRSFIAYDECVLVRDTLVNRSKQDRPLLISHRSEQSECKELWLGGRDIPMKTGASSVPSNPSVVVLSEDTGFGLVAHDDIFRVHYRGSYDGTKAELSDNSLVLRPGIIYRHEWLIVPLPKADYWHFANAVRRYFKTNFAIPGSFCFFQFGQNADTQTPWEALTHFNRKNTYFISVVLGVKYKGLFPHGPAKRTLDSTKANLANRVIRAIRPETKLLSYFNCFDCARREDDPVLWPDCRILLPNGDQVHNGKYYPLYFSTLDNEYGREMDANVDWLLNTVGADGLYWDCYQYNLSHYGDPWDGWTGDIDPASHKLKRKKSSTILLSWPWVEKTTARLLNESRPLVANGNPSLTSQYKYQFPRFVETADISALSRGHLYTPIALGDHITERNEVDAYRWMLRALDWGGLYYWYPNHQVTHHTLTTYMFPFTPIELHSGYIIGAERIITKVSGFFGWADLSEFEVHVFNRVGKETDKIKVPRVIKDGKAYAEVRIPEGFSAAIVRK